MQALLAELRALRVVERAARQMARHVVARGHTPQGCDSCRDLRDTLAKLDAAREEEPK